MGMLVTEVIEAGIKWGLGLLTPAGAFVKAAMAIVKIAQPRRAHEVVLHQPRESTH